MNTSELMLKFFQVYNYLLIEKAYRPISSWTHPWCGHCHSGLDVLALQVRAPVVALESSSVAPGLYRTCCRDHLPDHDVISIFHIILSVPEPVFDLVLSWILCDGDHKLHLILSDLFLWVRVYFPQQHTSISLLHTLDSSDDQGYFLQPVDVGVQYSKSVLELLGAH